MRQSYIYKVVGKDQYKVVRIDELKKKGEKGRYKEYIVDLRNGDMLCECPGFYYTKKACKHVKFILAQLSDKGGILDFQNKDNYEEFINSVK